MKVKVPCRIWLACACLGCLALNHVQAQLIASNLDAANNGGAGTVGSDKWAAQCFSTAASSYTLGSVTLRLAKEITTSATYNVSLWSATGTGGTPGFQLSPISSGNPVNALSTTLSDLTFTAPSGITLQANTSYFVVLSASTPSPSGLIWGVTQAENPGNTGPGQIGGWAFSANNGISWGTIPPTYSDETLSLGNPFQMAVSAVPEPALSAVVASVALLGFGLLRRFGPALFLA